MKTIWTGLILVVFSGFAMAQVAGLYDADVTERTAITDPAKATGKAEGRWLAFSLPALEGTRSPCCWKGKWSGIGEVGCSLESSHQSYGTRTNSPLTENVIVYTRIREGKVHSMRVVGQSCPLGADGAKVTWIGGVEEAAGLDWLEQVARAETRDSVNGLALYALALHHSPEAGQRLYTMALSNDEDLADEAIFWLGEARGEEGSQMLFDIAMDKQAPRTARRQAIFWLANSDDENTVAALTDLLTR